MPKRKKHSKEFKKQAVEFWETHDMSSHEVAAELGIRADMLRHWKKEFNKDKNREYTTQRRHENTSTVSPLCSSPACNLSGERHIYPGSKQKTQKAVPPKKFGTTSTP